MPNDFNQVASGTSENVKIASVRVAAECFLNLQGQPVHALAHVRPTDRKPHPHPGGDWDHRRSSTSSTSRSVDALTPSPTRTRYPANTTSISSLAPAGAVATGWSGITGTGINRSPASSAAAPRQRRRPAKTRVALTSHARATRDTDDPGANVAAT